jgi:hypothetical protein
LAGRRFVARVEALKNGTCRLNVKSAPGAGASVPQGAVRKLMERIHLQERYNRLREE